jgi:hypothetical protein
MNAKLLIVTDLGLLKAYKIEWRNDSSPRLTLLEELVFQTAHQHLADKITDSAGRRAAPAGGNTGGATMTDTHNMELETRRRLTRQIAQRIEALAGLHASEACWLAAQKEILRPVLEELPQALRPRIEKKIPLDLTKLEPKEILARFLAEA